MDSTLRQLKGLTGKLIGPLMDVCLPLGVARRSWLDVDDFKKINDEFGHKVGDEVINHLAEILKENIRAPDLAARTGGDEFAVLLVETTVVRGVEVADRLRQTIKASDFPTGGSEIITGASFGIAEFLSEERTTTELLVRRADAALYEAKRDGRNRVSQAQPVKRATRAERLIEQTLRSLKSPSRNVASSLGAITQPFMASQLHALVQSASTFL
jgi:diguanylate cyclase (GGDEF)-like protein